MQVLSIRVPLVLLSLSFGVSGEGKRIDKCFCFGCLFFSIPLIIAAIADTQSAFVAVATECDRRNQRDQLSKLRVLALKLMDIGTEYIDVVMNRFRGVFVHPDYSGIVSLFNKAKNCCR